MTAGYRVEGLPQLRRELRQFQGDANDLKDANAAVASLVASAAAAGAPKRSGALAGSVRGNRAVSRAQVKAGGAALPYAGPIHYGWPAQGIEGDPFVIDAAQSTEGTWVPIYQDAVEQAAQKVRGAA